MCVEKACRSFSQSYNISPLCKSYISAQKSFARDSFFVAFLILLSAVSSVEKSSGFKYIPTRQQKVLADWSLQNQFADKMPHCALAGFCKWLWHRSMQMPGDKWWTRAPKVSSNGKSPPPTSSALCEPPKGFFPYFSMQSFYQTSSNTFPYQLHAHEFRSYAARWRYIAWKNRQVNSCAGATYTAELELQRD